MTSKLTRERIELIANFHRAMTLPPSHAEIEELARMALAAMDSESGCLPLDYLQGHKDGLEWAAQLAEANHPETGDWLYDDPIELSKAIRKGPDMPPSQPAPVVPELMVDWQENEFSAGWNACRAAMLQAGNSPAQSDCCPAQNVVVPAQSPIDHGYLPECECSGCKATARICTEMAVNSLVIPNEMTSEQAYEIGYYYGDPVDVFARGANWMRQHIIDSTLAAAPQLPGSEPATVPGKWIPVSERMPEDDDFVYIWPRPDFGVELHVGQYCECSPKGDGWYAQVYEQNYGIEWHPITVTHWMPLPAGPKEDINALIPLVSRNEQEGK